MPTTDYTKLADYVETKSFQDFKVDVRDAFVLLDKANNAMVKDLLAIEQIDITWMDNLFRPDNESRKEKCKQLNATLTSKILTLRANLEMSYKSISQQGY